MRFAGTEKFIPEFAPLRTFIAVLSAAGVAVSAIMLLTSKEKNPSDESFEVAVLGKKPNRTALSNTAFNQVIREI